MLVTAPQATRFPLLEEGCLHALEENKRIMNLYEVPSAKIELKAGVGNK